MMTVGILAALCMTFIVVPVGMALTGRVSRPPTASEDNINNVSNAVFTLKVAGVTERFGAVILLVALLLAIAAVLGVSQLKVENRFIDYFDESTEIYQGMELVDAKLGGTIPLDVILFSSARDQLLLSEANSSGLDKDFDDEFSGGDDFGDDFLDDDFEEGSQGGSGSSQWFTRGGLEVVSRVHQYIDSLQETGKVLSLATVYQIASDLLGGQADDIQLAIAQRSLPESIKASLIDPYLNVGEDEARITVRVKETSRTLNRSELLANLHEFMQSEMGLKPDQYRLTGMLVLYNNMLQSLFKSQILTLGIVFVAITAMLFILFRSFSLALLAILPNMLAALMVLGGMGWVGLPLDLMTITIAAISIGIGVDNTIHYVHRFKTEFVLDRNYLQTMYRCHGSIGRAMYYTSITIIFGFSILALSNFNPSIYFGLLTGFAMFSALVGALMLLPRLLIFFKPLGPEN